MRRADGWHGTYPYDLKKFMASALPSTIIPPMNSAMTFSVISMPVMAATTPIGMTKMRHSRIPYNTTAGDVYVGHSAIPSTPRTIEIISVPRYHHSETIHHLVSD